MLLFLCVGVIATNPEARKKLSLAYTVCQIDTMNEWLLMTVLMTVGYCFKFFFVAYILEFKINPIPKTERRMEEIRKQIKMSVVALIVVCVISAGWFWLIEPHTPYYGYFETHEYTFGEFVKNVVIYLLAFDTYYYWFHRMLHLDWFMKKVHAHHHQFMEPTAFAQDAVHPFESFLQGPFGHFLATLIYPMHPVTITVIGFLTSCYALLAHDGTWGDLNEHHYHHWYHRCNYGLYWGLWDFICDTRYSEKKYPVRYIPTWEKEALEAEKKKAKQN